MFRDLHRMQKIKSAIGKHGKRPANRIYKLFGRLCMMPT
jgi:hypothetical protein